MNWTAQTKHANWILITLEKFTASNDYDRYTNFKPFTGVVNQMSVLRVAALCSG
jgi:hypothetical protein